MNPRYSTILDDLFPDSLPEFANIADAWPQHVVEQILTLVWRGFDRLKRLPRFGELDLSGNYAQLERSLTDLHMDEITLLWGHESSRFEAFVPKHEPWEFRSLTAPSARPPSCDLGFVLVSNRRIRWCVETKVVKSPNAISEYICDLQKFLVGTSSPFSTEGALGAYLITGKSTDLLSAIEVALGSRMRQHSRFRNRLHRLSDHLRHIDNLPAGMPSEFVCHHLIFALS